MFRQQTIQLAVSVQRLLAFLALQGRPVGRTYAASMLWPDTTNLKAGASLRTSLWRVQCVEGRLVDVSAQHLALARHVAVDLRHAEHHAWRLLDAGADLDDVLSPTTCAELSADLLPDWYDDWVLIERERYHHLRLNALEAMCQRLTRMGRFGEAVMAGLTAVQAEPLRESAHRAVIETHLAAGNRWDAVQQYELCRHLLRAELDLEPSPELRDLLPVPAGFGPEPDDRALQDPTPAPRNKAQTNAARVIGNRRPYREHSAGRIATPRPR